MAVTLRYNPLLAMWNIHVFFFRRKCSMMFPTNKNLHMSCRRKPEDHLRLPVNSRRKHKAGMTPWKSLEIGDHGRISISTLRRTIFQGCQIPKIEMEQFKLQRHEIFRYSKHDSRLHPDFQKYSLRSAKLTVSGARSLL